MSLETETVLDRRALRRRLTWWRGFGVLAALLAAGLLFFSSPEGTSLTDRRQIARVSLEGLITEDRDQLKLLKRLAEAKHVSAVILFVNSPGGTTTGGEALFEGIRELAKAKPVVAQFGTLATSAAYIVGLATDQIVARGNTITGSVGVIFQWAEVSQLLDKLGIKMNEIKSGPLKANPSPFQPLDERGKAIAEQMVAESQKWFVNLVATRRGIEPARVDGLEQGRVFSGREALSHKLVDQLGGEAEAVAYLEQKRNVPKGLKVIDWKPQSESDWSLVGVTTRTMARLFRSLGGDHIAQLVGDETRLGALRLDGLVSIWHGAER